MILERITHFKAAELKNFLLFYSFSCLIGILPQDQFYHFSLLVYAPFFFRKKSLPRTFISAREWWWNMWYIPALYGDRYSTSNVHLLLHITDSVADLGPLWSTSCFYFEDFYGQLRRLFHGTQSIQETDCVAVCVCINLFQRWLKHCTMEVANKNFSKEWSTKSINQHTKVFVVGANHNRPMWTEEQHAVFLLGGDLI